MLFRRTSKSGQPDPPMENSERFRAPLFNTLRDNCIRDGLRLEQEHIGFGWVRRQIEQLVDPRLR